MEERGLTVMGLYLIFNNFTPNTTIKFFDKCGNLLFVCKYRRLPDKYKFYTVEWFDFAYECIYICINIDESVVEEN